MLADFSRALRLVWIDYQANQPEGLCRQDLFRVFGCSTATAGSDLAAYARMNKKHFTYNLGRRRYTAQGCLYLPRQHQIVIEAVDLAQLINTKKDAKKNG